MRNYDVILFDMDDTLFDYRRSEREALKKTMLARGLEPTAERLERYHVISESLWRQYEQGEVDSAWLVTERFARFGKELGCGADPAEWNRETAEQIGRECWLVPGAESICRLLSQAGCRLYLVTNGTGVSQRMRLERSSLSACFSGILISGELGVRKPEPGFFQAAFRMVGPMPHRRILLVGDSLEADIAGAARSGIDSAWLRQEGQVPGAWLPTYVLENLEDLREIVLAKEADTPQDHTTSRKELEEEGGMR